MSGNSAERSRTVPAAPSGMNTYDFLRNRETGAKRKIGSDDDIAIKFYRSFDSYKLNEENLPRRPKARANGGIFNLEFSQDGRMLVAACEHKSVLIYDAGNQKKLQTLENAHLSCVNCVRFLSDRTFATCSDDTSIKLWDIRWLNRSTKTLHGHSNWVKNIEFSESENVMVTSAFDGSVYAWDLGSPTENSMLYDKVFLMNGLMRTKLSPDGTKMIISSTNGYMIIIHDLNLKRLGNDLHTFRPGLYRLMQTTEQIFPAAAIFNYLFHPGQRRNCIEIIDDFPDEAEVISSLQIHPQGWVALSRNVTEKETEEWTCVHDIHKRYPSEDDDPFTYIEENTDSEEDVNVRPTDLWMGYISNDQYNSEQHSSPDMYENYFQLPSMGIINSGLIGRNTYDTYFQQYPNHRNKMIKNSPRLTHYIKERNVGKGYIKELCFSSDGRVICSPYHKGIRLLGFSEKSEEITYCLPDQPQRLTTLVEMDNYHSDVVVSSRFNPVHLQLVSGCLGGDIVWYQPVL